VDQFTGSGHDVYIIESWFGERLNVRHVYAADADDALQTHGVAAYFVSK